MQSPRTPQKGFIALVSALVISAMLLVIVFSVGTSSFYARFDALGGENKRISLGLAESCINVALLALATSTSPSTYSPTNQIVQIGTDSQGNPMTCTIQSIAHSGNVATVDVQAEWRGTFSNVTARATIPDPSTGTLVPPPTCALTASPGSVPQGQQVLLQWASSAGATGFALDNGAPSGLSTSGSLTVTAAGVGSVTYTGTVTGPGGTGQCTATYIVLPPPPTPACADTMMVFDRSGSLNATDRANMKSAANQLITLYGDVHNKVPGFNPKIGAGFFGARANGNSAEIPTDSPNNGQLGTNYPNLVATVNNLIDDPNGQNGSNLGEGVHVVYDEYNSARATPGFQHVLIFVSDGEPNRATPDGTCSSTDPTDSLWCRADFSKINGVSIFTVQYTHQGNQTTAATARALLAKIATGTVPYLNHRPGSEDNSLVNANTGWKYPSATHSPNTWTGATNAYATDGVYMTDMLSGHQQGLATFNITGMPSGATITGIETSVTGLLSANLSGANTPQLFPTTEGNFPAWFLQSTTTKMKAVLVDEGSTDPANGGYITTSTANAGQTFAFPGAVIPAGSTINSVSVSAVARFSGGASAPHISLRAEQGVGTQRDGPDNTVSNVSPYQTYIWTMSANPFTNNPWTLAEVTNWGATRFGVVKTNSSGTVRVTQLYVTVNYTPPMQSSCTVGVDLSWNNGSSWSPSKNITLTDTESAVAPTGNSSTDTWGRTWNSTNDFTNTNFVVRLTNNTCTGATLANVNSVAVKVHYTGLDFNAENNDGDGFFVTPDTSNPASIQNIFDTIGKLVCPAAAARCANGIDDDGDGLADSADPQCHIGGSLSNPYDGTINNEYQAPAPPGPPTAPAPPPSVDLGSWQEIPQ